MTIIIGRMEEESTTYSFDEDDIMETFGGPLSQEGLEQIANVLAYNIEGNFSKDEVVEIVRSNFNDSFDDMVADLTDEVELGNIV
jgi:hypothetical protein